MALTDAHWGKILEVLPILTGGNLAEPGVVIVAFKEHWDLINSESALDEYIKTAKLAQVKANRDAQQVHLDKLNAEIAELEGN